ncbi:hypothetical protein GCM10023194_73660 [Planotetraspora phitsanulokensis]|uniref:FG-GAP repeat-containing protein n=1 Tax=Planotetraspora phitsanulokensis TaxID=575192 RepID=A0A8J3U2Q2_9ACTN|nr:FG-GAP repeat protein [Planotetraspora phitsanulokensis]GII37135.1 hypothetical protein Pph01_21380 [Planotetraspora phitsanulokensis]
MRLLHTVPAVLLMLTALFSPDTALAQDGCSTAGPADFNGDGLADAVVGDPFADVQGKEGAGAVHVLLGGGRSSGVLVLQSPDAASGDGFGWSVRTVHADGDRCLDVVVGAPYSDGEGSRDAGAAYVFHGTPSGLPEVTRLLPERQPNAHFGWSLAAAESPSGGALVAVGEPHADRDGVTDSGAVHLFEVGDTAKASAIITQESEGVPGNSEIGDMYGWALALGHLGGRPGELDLAVGVPFENDDGAGRQVASGKADAGAVGVVFDVQAARGRYAGTALGPQGDRRSTGRFGYALDYAEWRGDGFLAASAPRASGDSGMVELFARKGAGEVSPLRTFPAESGELGGGSLAFWNREGVLSLAIGSRMTPALDPGLSGVLRPILADNAVTSGAVPDVSVGAFVHDGAAVSDVGGRSAFEPGTGLLVGLPDAGPTGSVAVIDRGAPVYHGPGKIDGGASADFGAAVAG